MMQFKDIAFKCLSKQQSYICCLQRTHLRMRSTQRLKVKREKNNISCKWTHKKAVVTIRILYKMNFRTKFIEKGNENST